VKKNNKGPTPQRYSGGHQKPTGPRTKSEKKHTAGGGERPPKQTVNRKKKAQEWGEGGKAVTFRSKRPRKQEQETASQGETMGEED